MILRPINKSSAVFSLRSFCCASFRRPYQTDKKVSANTDAKAIKSGVERFSNAFIKITGSQKLSTDYEVVHEYDQYQHMQGGELIARDTTGKNPDILAQPNRTLIFPLPAGRITTTSDDEFFYSEPAKVTQIQGIKARLK